MKKLAHQFLSKLLAKVQRLWIPNLEMLTDNVDVGVASQKIALGKETQSSRAKASGFGFLIVHEHGHEVGTKQVSLSRDVLSGNITTGVQKIQKSQKSSRTLDALFMRGLSENA